MSLFSKKHQSSRMLSICVVNDKCLPYRTTHVDMGCGKENQQILGPMITKCLLNQS